MKSLDQMINGMHTHARTTLIGKADEQVLPLFHIQFKDRPDAIMAAPFSSERDKAHFIQAMRMAMDAFRRSVVNYAMISEAWAADYDHPPRPGDLMPSQRETRRECVIVSAGDHDGARMKVWEIIRDDQGRVTDLVEEKKLADQMGGRMHNLLGEDE
jgi:hypothetical protein